MVPGKSECKSLSLAMFFQVVVFCCHILLSHFITDVCSSLAQDKQLPARFCMVAERWPPFTTEQFGELVASMVALSQALSANAKIAAAMTPGGGADRRDRGSRKLSMKPFNRVTKFAQGEAQWKEFHFDFGVLTGAEYPPLLETLKVVEQMTDETDTPMVRALDGRFRTQATWLRINKMAPHQCWNVCDLEIAEKDKLSSLSSHMHTTKVRKPIFRKWPSHLRTSYSHQQSGTKEGTGHPRSDGEYADRLDLEKVSKELYEVLVMVTEGEAKLMVKNVINNDGVLAYRRLYRHNNRRTLASVLRMIGEALQPKAVHDLKQLISKVVEWEDKRARMAAEHKETLPMISKMAALVELCPPDVHDVVYQNVDGVSEDYDKLKQRILAWAANKVANSVGPVPMDVGWVHNQEQDERVEQEDVGAVTMNTVCHGCGGCGDLKWESPTLQQNEKANRKSGYEKGKGKGKGVTDVYRGGGKGKGKGDKGAGKRRLQRNLLQVRKTRTQGRRLQDPSGHGGRVRGRGRV